MFSDGVAWLATADGRFWGVDDHGRGRLADQLPAPIQSLKIRIDHTTNGAKIPRVELQFQGAPRQHLIVGDKPFAPGFEVLNGRFLPALAANAVLVLHTETVESNAPQVITALDLDGNRRWSVPLEATEVHEVWFVDGALVVFAADTLISIDAGNGRVRWRHATQ